MTQATVGSGREMGAGVVLALVVCVPLSLGMLYVFVCLLLRSVREGSIAMAWFIALALIWIAFAAPLMFSAWWVLAVLGQTRESGGQ